MTTQTRIKGDDGRWHEQGCPYVADDESDQVLADYGECVCAPLATPTRTLDELIEQLRRYDVRYALRKVAQ